MPDDFFASNYEESSLVNKYYFEVPTMYAVINKKYIEFEPNSIKLKNDIDLRKIIYKYYNVPYYGDFINQLHDIYLKMNTICGIKDNISTFDNDQKVFDMRVVYKKPIIDDIYYQRDFDKRTEEILTEYYKIQNFINDEAKKREEELRSKLRSKLIN